MSQALPVRGVRPDLSLVIPAFDETVRLPQTLDRIERRFSPSEVRERA